MLTASRDAVRAHKSNIYLYLVLIAFALSVLKASYMYKHPCAPPHNEQRPSRWPSHSTQLPKSTAAPTHTQLLHPTPRARAPAPLFFDDRTPESTVSLALATNDPTVALGAGASFPFIASATSLNFANPTDGGDA